MTTPHDPSDEPSRDPENETGYPSYPSTPHPEDAPGFGQQSFPGYSGYSGYAAEEYRTPGPQQGTGRVSPTAAVGWGLRTTFRNWQVWILGALALGVVSVLASMAVEYAFGGFGGDTSYQTTTGYRLVQLLILLLTQAVMIFVYTGALRQVDKPRIGWGDFTRDVNFGPAFGVAAVLFVVSAAAVSLVLVPLVLGGDEIANAQLASQDEALAFLSKLFAALAVYGLVAVFISPLTMFMVWFPVDRRTGFAGAFGAALRAGGRNYLPLLLFTILAGLAAGLLSLITFGLAMIVLIPALLLTQAHLFRQAAQGPLPAAPGV